MKQSCTPHPKDLAVARRGLARGRAGDRHRRDPLLFEPMQQPGLMRRLSRLFGGDPGYAACARGWSAESSSGSGAMAHRKKMLLSDFVIWTEAGLMSRRTTQPNHSTFSLSGELLVGTWPRRRSADVRVCEFSMPRKPAHLEPHQRTTQTRTSALP